MKVKLYWFSFIPAFILVGLVNILELAGVLQLLPLPSASYLSIIIICASFVANLIFSLINKKISPILFLQKNVVTGVFCLLTAGTISSKAFLTIIQSLQASHIEFLNLLQCIVGIIASIAMVILAISHFQGKNYAPRMGILFFSIPLWLLLILVEEFLSNRILSPSDIEPIRSFLLIFAMLLFLNISMVVAAIEGKNPVKGTLNYGFPFVIFGLLYGVNAIVDIIKNGLDYSENIIGITFLFMAVYVFLFNKEIIKNAMSVDQIDVVFDAEEFNEFNEYYYSMTDDELLLSERDNDDDNDDYYYGYGYGYGENDEDAEDYVVSATEQIEDYGYGEVDTDDLIVEAENNDANVDEDVAIFVSKDAAKIFEDKVFNDDDISFDDIIHTDIDD